MTIWNYLILNDENKYLREEPWRYFVTALRHPREKNGKNVNGTIA